MRLPRLKTSSLPSLRTNTMTLDRKENYGQGRGGRQWRRIKQQVHERDEWTCCACGQVRLDLECDHIVNKAEGGSDDLSNLQSLCKPCHDIKTLEESKRGLQR